VRRRSLLSRSEEKALDLLERSLFGRGYRVYVLVPLRKLIDPETTVLRPEQRRMLDRGEVDFLIVNRDEGLRVEFALEFDGHPAHRNDPDRRAADRVKDALCLRAGLPLVRVDPEAIGEREQVTLIDWLIDCFRLLRSDPERVETVRVHLNERDADVAADTGDRRAPVDLAVALHMLNPFPATVEIRERLWRRYQIASQPTEDLEPLPLNDEDARQRLDDFTARLERWGRAPLKLYDMNRPPSLVPSEEDHDELEVARGPLNPNVFQLGLWNDFQSGFAYVARAPIRWAAQPLWAQLLAAERIGSWRWAIDVALAEYEALADIERWATRRLARMDRG
jgi:Protein of unknown function (DUF2726)